MHSLRVFFNFLPKKPLHFRWYSSAPDFYNYNYSMIKHFWYLLNKQPIPSWGSSARQPQTGLFQVALEHLTNTESPVHRHLLEWVCNHSLVLLQVPSVFVFLSLHTLSSSPVLHSFIFSPPSKCYPTNYNPSDLDRVPFRYDNITIAMKWHRPQVL